MRYVKIGELQMSSIEAKPMIKGIRRIVKLANSTTSIKLGKLRIKNRISVLVDEEEAFCGVAAIHNYIRGFVDACNDCRSGLPNRQIANYEEVDYYG